MSNHLTLPGIDVSGHFVRIWVIAVASCERTTLWRVGVVIFGRVTVRGYTVLLFHFCYHTNLEHIFNYRNCYIRISVSYD